jgi:hypothetical protein
MKENTGITSLQYCMAHDIPPLEHELTKNGKISVISISSISNWIGVTGSDRRCPLKHRLLPRRRENLQKPDCMCNGAILPC